MTRDNVIKIDDSFADALGLRFYPGYMNAFTRAEYPGAMRNGTRVTKVNSMPNDRVIDGHCGVVLGSVGHPDAGVAYFVEWDGDPTRAILCVATRLEAAR